MWWYDDKESTFQELLQLIKSVNVYHKKIQTVTTDGYKIVNEICPAITKILFSSRKKQM